MRLVDHVSKGCSPSVDVFLLFRFLLMLLYHTFELFHPSPLFIRVGRAEINIDVI